MADKELDPDKITNATTNQEIVALLKDDMKGEHAAIIQYLQHAYKMGEGEIGTEVEGIARDEMRHFRWLGELVVELGGDPTMERDPIFLDTPKDFELLILDVEAEDRAIEKYEHHLSIIQHEKARRTIARILVDERTHRAMFRDYVKELGGDPNQKINPPVGPWDLSDKATPQNLEITSGGQTQAADMDEEGRNDHPLIRLLNNRVRQEYVTITTYLHRAFASWKSDPELSRTLIEDQAVWHMTHMGNISEAVAGMGGVPEMVDMPLPKNVENSSNQEFARWGQQHEGELAGGADELLAAIKQSENQAGGGHDEAEEIEDLERQVSRMGEHNRFMQYQFEQELKGKNSA